MNLPSPRFLPVAALCVGLLLILACSASAQSASVRVKERLPVSAVWAGHPVGFALLTDSPRGRQYAGYYDADRNMVIASRPLDSAEWTRKVLPTRVGWDSHNYITLATDRAGHLHVAGNLHNTPLIYFRTVVSGEVTSLVRVPAMTGDGEQRMTYPQFITGADGTLLFTYRDGQSGSGTNLYNRYDEKTARWSRLLDTPLFDGQGRMNAYPDGPILGPDGFWHSSWVWRDTPHAETNHDLSYARSRDLVNWETVAGRSVRLPLTLQTPGLVLDPIPVNGGIINGSGKLGFDEHGRVIVAYHKFDDQGATQLYLARAEDGAWRIRQVTQWTHRWEPRGLGSIPFDVRHSGVRNDPAIGLYITINHARHGSGAWRINPATLELGDKIPNNRMPGGLPSEIVRGVGPGLELRTASDLGKAPEGLRYVLRWETLPSNRDQPREGTPPAPGKLELIILETAPPAASAL